MKDEEGRPVFNNVKLVDFTHNRRTGHPKLLEEKVDVILADTAMMVNSNKKGTLWVPFDAILDVKHDLRSETTKLEQFLGWGLTGLLVGPPDSTYWVFIHYGNPETPKTISLRLKRWQRAVLSGALLEKSGLDGEFLRIRY